MCSTLLKCSAFRDKWAFCRMLEAGKRTSVRICDSLAQSSCNTAAPVGPAGLQGRSSGHRVTGSRAISASWASVGGATQTVRSTKAPPTAQPRRVQPNTILGTRSSCYTWLVHIGCIPHLKHCYLTINANVQLAAGVYFPVIGGGFPWRMLTMLTMLIS